MIVENAIYVDGRRTADPASLQETFDVCRQRRGVAWIDLQEPNEEELSSVAQEFGLHPLAVEDAIKAHQRPKLERYDETLFVVLKPARYLEESGTLEFSEAHVFVGENFVVTVRQPVRFHDLRHTCATLLFGRGVHPKYVQELLGHANIAITLDTYSHVIPGMGDQTARAMEDALTQLKSRYTTNSNSSSSISFSPLDLFSP